MKTQRTRLVFSCDAIDSRDANAIYLPNLTPFLAFLVACCTEYLTCGFRKQEYAQVEFSYIPKMEYLSNILLGPTSGCGCFTAAVRIDKLYLLVGLYINVSLQHVLTLFTSITHICITCVICVLKLLVVSFRPFFTLFIFSFGVMFPLKCHFVIHL